MSRPRVRRYFLWDTFQPRFVRLSLCYQIVVVAALAGALFLPLMLQLERLPPASQDALTVADHFLLLHSRFWPAVFVASILLAVHGVFFSHRIAGPLYRFRQIFREVARGDLMVRTSIRKGDYLHAEAECLSAMVSALRDKIGSIESCHQEMNVVMDSLKQAVERGSMPEVEAATGQLRFTVEQLSRAIESFRTKPAAASPAETPLPAASGF
ncbi:MAG: methyl-accepting chemotaxis protein [Nitrospira defluvii]|nr:methyl-accepting chemotaxis protein [Nitrospira defluvii]